MYYFINNVHTLFYNLLITKNRSSVSLTQRILITRCELPGTIWRLRDSRDDRVFWTSVVATPFLNGSGPADVRALIEREENRDLAPSSDRIGERQRPDLRSKLELKQYFCQTRSWVIRVQPVFISRRFTCFLNTQISVSYLWYYKFKHVPSCL